MNKAKATTTRKTATHTWDVAEHLRTPEEMALYLSACIEESDGDAAFVAKALGDVARANGMTQLAHETGLGRESLYKALSSTGNPGLDTVLKVTRALGMRLSVLPARQTGDDASGAGLPQTTSLPG